MDERIQPLPTTATHCAATTVFPCSLSTSIPNKSTISKVRKTRQGRGSRNLKYKKLTLFGNNINGLNGKWESLLHALEYLDSPSCILIQEKKLSSQFLKKINGYEIFNKQRKIAY